MVVMLFLVGCGAGESNEFAGLKGPAGSLEFKTEAELAPNSLFVSGSSESQVSSESFQRMLKLDPIAQARCDFPKDAAFNELADSLGGFAKPYSIPIARNDAQAFYYTGMKPQLFLEDEAAANSADVTIERGDLIGQYNNTAFYLAKPHGLMAVTVNSQDSSLSEVSCVFPLPGRPINFYIRDNNIIVLINSVGDGAKASVLNLKWQDDKFEFIDALLLPKVHIGDSRRFNDSLVMTGKSVEGAEGNSQDNSGNELAVNHVLTHLIHVNLTNLSLQWQETFNPDSRFNNSMSATDEYLVLKENYSEQIGTETRSYRYCDVYSEPVSYERCSVNWKQIPNPDYEAPVFAGGVVACGEDLTACLQQKGPKLNPYIYKADGQTCNTYTRTSCIGYKVRTYDRPVYQEYTAFRIYRFTNGEFIRLDDKVSILENQQLALSDKRVQIEGTIPSHEYLQFQNGFFYAISNEGVLSTFTIQGNSVIKTSTISGLGNRGDIRSVEFSENHIMLGKEGGFQSLNISNPSQPQLAGFIASPGQLHQLIFDENYIIGFGNLFIDQSNGYRHYYEKLSLYSLFDTAQELDNYLLGTDFSNTYSSANYDDQAFKYDFNLSRLFLPLYSYGQLPGGGYVYQERLGIVDREQDTLIIPEVINLPEKVERIISVNENNALAFSKNYIYQLNKSNVWSANLLKMLNHPSKVYAVPGSDLWMVYQKTEQGSEVYSNPRDDLFNLPAQSKVEFTAAKSQVCILAKVYFANNSVFQVSEKLGVFTTAADCDKAEDMAMSDYLDFKGWQFTGQGTFTPVSDSDLQGMYQQVLEVRDQYCVLDTENLNGERVYITSLQDDAGQFTCMDSETFYRPLD